jgi:hypothetical protein
LEVFRIELNTVFHCTLVYEKTNDRLYSYADSLDPQQSMMWNLEDYKKTHEQLGKLVYSKTIGFTVPNDSRFSVSHSKNIQKKIVVFV